MSQPNPTHVRGCLGCLEIGLIVIGAFFFFSFGCTFVKKDDNPDLQTFCTGVTVAGLLLMALGGAIRVIEKKWG